MAEFVQLLRCTHGRLLCRPGFRPSSEGTYTSTDGWRYDKRTPASAPTVGGGVAWAAIGSLALPAGPLIGGALITGFGWRAVFLINAPIVAVSALAAIAVVRESTDRNARRLDLPGVLLGVLVLPAITFAFIEGGRAGAFSPAVIGAAIAGLALLAAFIFHRVAPG